MGEKSWEEIWEELDDNLREKFAGIISDKGQLIDISEPPLKTPMQEYLSTVWKEMLEGRAVLKIVDHGLTAKEMAELASLGFEFDDDDAIVFRNPKPSPKSKPVEPNNSSAASIPPGPGERPLAGWNEIAKFLGWSLRKAQYHRKQLILEGYLKYELKGKPPRKRPVAWPSDLKKYAKQTGKNR